MGRYSVDSGLVFLGALYVVPEFFIIIKFSGDLEPWSFWLLILWLPLFLTVYYWRLERSLAYGFLGAVLVNIGILGCLALVLRMIFQQKLAGI